MNSNHEMPPDPADLLAHAAWLTSLARALVRDVNTADDLVQETWVASLRRPPSRALPLRPWLATVLRNLVASAGRRRKYDSARSVAVENHLRDTESAPNAEDLLARHQVLMRLAALVDNLDEPFRNTILLWYAEGLRPQEIARKQGIPEGTVRWRLKRGLDDLRCAITPQRQEVHRVLAPLLLVRQSPLKKIATSQTTGAAVRRGPSLRVALGGTFAGILALIWLSHESDKLRLALESLHANTGPTPSFLGSLAAHENPRDTAIVRGVVRTAEGVAIANALVTLNAQTPEPELPLTGGGILETYTYTSKPPGCCALRTAPTQVSNGDGVFFFRAPPGAYALSAAHPEAGTDATSPFTVAAASDNAQHALVLQHTGHRVSGRVRDVGGGILVGALVTLRAGEPGSTNAIQALTSAAGTFTVFLAPEHYEIGVRAPGYAPLRQKETVTHERTLDLIMAPANRVTGFVTDGVTNQPMDDADVWLVADRANITTSARTRTDASGAFSLDDLRSGVFQVCARKGALLGVSAPQRLITGEHSVPHPILLYPAASFSGTVKDHTGAAVPGAQVEAVQNIPPYDRLGAVTTDGAGHFETPGLLPGSYALRVRHEKYSPSKIFASTSKAAEPLSITMMPAAALIVRTNTSKNISKTSAGLELQITLPGVEQIARYQSRVRSDEAFIFNDLPAGTFSLVATDNEGQLSGLVEGTLEPGQTKKLDVFLSHGAFISGVVKTPEGRAVSDAHIRVWPRIKGFYSRELDITGADGKFRIGPFPAGAITVVAAATTPLFFLDKNDHPHMKTFNLDAAQEKADVVLTIPAPNGRVGGVVLDADGAFVAGAQVQALYADRLAVSEPPAASRVATTDSAGAFVIDDVADTHVTLSVAHPDFPSVVQENITLGDTSLRLRLPREARCSGLVRDRAGRTITSYSITAVPKDAKWADITDPPTQTVNAPHGQFSFMRLAPGPYELQVATGDGRVAQTQVTIDSTTAPLSLLVDEGISFPVLVLDATTGAPVPRVSIHASFVGGFSAGAYSDTNGLATIARIPPKTRVSLGAVPQDATHGRLDLWTDIPGETPSTPLVLRLPRMP